MLCMETWRRSLLVYTVGFLQIGCIGEAGKGFYGQSKQKPVVHSSTPTPEPIQEKPITHQNTPPASSSANAAHAAPTPTSTPVPLPPQVPVQPVVFVPQVPVMPPPPPPNQVVVANPPPQLPIPMPVSPVIPAETGNPELAMGSMEFVIQAFANMEHGYHALDHGYRAVLEDSQGVVASARLNADACVNSESLDQPGQGPTRVKLAPDAQYIRSGAASGSAKLSICLDNNFSRPDAPADCQDVSAKSLAGPDPERATQFQNQVQYRVAGQQVQVETNSPGLSAWHPVFGFACPNRSFNDFQSPIVFDLNKNGSPDLIDVWQDRRKVYFDLRGEGKKIRTGWVDKSDGLLVYQETKESAVEDGTVLFGEYSLKRGQPGSKGMRNFENGFAALNQYDDNKDGHIDAKDEVFSKLKIWRDRNSNGNADKGEMQSLATFGIVDIYLAYENAGTDVSPYVVADNQVKLKGVYKTADGKSHQLFDVWFKQRRYSDVAEVSHRK